MASSPALYIALVLCILASSASPAPATPDSTPSRADSKPGLSKSSAFHGVDGADAAMDEVVGAAAEGEDDEAATHKIRVRDAGPVRFWSGSRYGRSGRSAGTTGASESQAHGSTMGMSMSLRSSGPVIQPRHDRFFLGSRYGKRGQGPRGAAEWRRGASGEEEEEGAEQEGRGGEEEEDVARAVKEALRMRALPGDSEEVFGVSSQRVSSAPLQPASCIYMGIGNLYRCYEGRREAGVH